MKTTYNQDQVQALVASMKNGQRVTKQDIERILADLTKKTLCDLAKALDLHRYSTLCREAVVDMILEWYEDMPGKSDEDEADADDDEPEAEAEKKALEHEIENNVYEDLSDEARDYLKDHPELRADMWHDPSELRYNKAALLDYYESLSCQTYRNLSEAMDREEAKILEEIDTYLPQYLSDTAKDYLEKHPELNVPQQKLQSFIKANHIPEDFLRYCVTESELVYNQEHHAGMPLSYFPFKSPQSAFDVTTLSAEQAYAVLEQCEYYLEDHANEAKEVVEIEAPTQAPELGIRPTGILARLLNRMIANVQEAQQKEQYLLASC